MPSNLRVHDIGDKSIKSALQKALADDKRISIQEAYDIVEAAIDKDGISGQERKDLRLVFSRSTTVDQAVKKEILKWLDRCDRLATRIRYSAVSRSYGAIPNGWKGSEYDTGGGGTCAVKLSPALKAAGMSLAGFNWKYTWKNELPVNANELAAFLRTKFGDGEKVNRNSPGMNVRQGILYINGAWSAKHGQPVGHITLWNGEKCEDGTSYDIQKGASLCSFWELRPDWLTG